MALDFMSLLDQWENMGVFNVLFPFLLVFAITFAVLEKLAIFQGKRQINGIVAAVLGILVVRNQYIVGLINRFLPNVSLFMIVILMFLLLIGIFAGDSKIFRGSLLGLSAVISLIFVVWSLSSDFVGEKFGLPDWLYGLDEQTKSAILFIGIFVVVIWLVTRDSGGGSGATGPAFGNWFSRLGGEMQPPPTIKPPGT